MTLPSDELEVAPQLTKVFAVVRKTQWAPFRVDSLWRTRRGAGHRLYEMPIGHDWNVVEMPVSELGSRLDVSTVTVGQEDEMGLPDFVADSRKEPPPPPDQRDEHQELGRSLWEAQAHSPRGIMREIAEEVFAERLGKVRVGICSQARHGRELGTYTCSSSCPVCGGSAYVIEEVSE